MKWMAGHPIWAGVGILFGVGFVAAYWELLVAGVAVAVICYSLYRVALWWELEREKRAARARWLAYRADYEDWYVRQGWNGIYR